MNDVHYGTTYRISEELCLGKDYDRRNPAWYQVCHSRIQRKSLCLNHQSIDQQILCNKGHFNIVNASFVREKQGAAIYKEVVGRGRVRGEDAMKINIDTKEDQGEEGNN